MKQLSAVAFFILVTFSSFGQSEEIGQLRLLNTSILKSAASSEDFCGYKTATTRLLITSKTRVQLSCSFGDPRNNIWDTVTNKFYICYTADSSGLIYKAMLSEIKNYLEGPPTGKNFSQATYRKSFFKSNDFYIPFVSTDGETKGHYQVYYVNGCVYKIILLEGNGFGNLGLFAEQNMYFVQDNKRMELGRYLINPDEIRQVLEQ